MTTPEKQPPSPNEVDQLALEMLKIRGEISTIEAEAAGKVCPLLARSLELKSQAERWLREFGSAHAEKSKLLHGVGYEILGTFGTSTSIDAAAVEVFRQALVKAHQGRIVSKIFQKTVRWSLVSGWAEIIRGSKLPAKLLALYARCQVSSERTPTIVPREKKASAA